MPNTIKIIIVTVVAIAIAVIVYASIRLSQPVQLVPLMPVPSPAPPASQNNLIRVIEPSPNDTVASPLKVQGVARGNWYFEASFPIAIVDANGLELGRVAAEAQGDWMTTDFVPFIATLVFRMPATDAGELVLEKSNPSGLPEQTAEIRLPIRFIKLSPTVADNCLVSGCSNEICAEKERVSPCIYKEEFACYRTARCEKQGSGVCGWTETEDFSACLMKATANEITPSL